MMVIQSEVKNKRSIIKVLIFQGEANFHLEEFVLSCINIDYNNLKNKHDK